MTVSVTEAKNKFAELLSKAEKGERIIIERRGKPVAELAKAQVKRERISGTLAHKKIILDPNWDRPQNDLDAWLAGDV